MDNKPKSKTRFVLPTLAVLSVCVLCLVLAINYPRGRDFDGEYTLRTEYDLKQLAYDVQLHVRLAKSSPPADIRALVDWLDQAWPERRQYLCWEGWLDPQTNSLIDRWRNPLRLVAESPRRYKFISRGANEKDEDGLGDDIVYYFDPLEKWEQRDLKRPQP